MTVIDGKCGVVMAVVLLRYIWDCLFVVVVLVYSTSFVFFSSQLLLFTSPHFFPVYLYLQFVLSLWFSSTRELFCNSFKKSSSFRIACLRMISSVACFHVHCLLYLAPYVLSDVHGLGLFELLHMMPRGVFLFC